MNLIENHKNQIISLCESHEVEKLYLFGSATSDDFSANSDVDFLVKFKTIDLKNYFINYYTLKQELKSLLKRKIDLLEEQTLKNPYLIQSINKNKQLIYG